MIEYEILKKKNFLSKLLQDLASSAFSKVQKLTSKFSKTPETKKMSNKIFNRFKVFYVFHTVNLNFIEK